MVTDGYRELPGVTAGYRRLPKVGRRLPWRAQVPIGRQEDEEDWGTLGNNRYNVTLSLTSKEFDENNRYTNRYKNGYDRNIVDLG